MEINSTLSVDKLNFKDRYLIFSQLSRWRSEIVWQNDRFVWA